MKTIHDTHFSLNFSTAVFQWEKKVKRNSGTLELHVCFAYHLLAC